MLKVFASPYFLYSFGILLREGLEAMLVVIALAAGVRQMGERGRVRPIYGGALAALAASIGLAWAVNHLLSDDAGDRLEGALQLVAAATLFYVSSWLTAKTQAGRWQHFIDARLQSSERSALPSLTLGATAFLAVMREGAETIVFFQALLAGANAGIEQRAVVAGVAVAGVGLAIAFVVLQGAATKAPLRLFFRATSILLYSLAVVFVGQGIASWQEAGLVGATFVGHVPTIKALGLYPTVQSLAAQALLAAVALAATLGRGRTRSSHARRGLVTETSAKPRAVSSLAGPGPGVLG